MNRRHRRARIKPSAPSEQETFAEAVSCRQSGHYAEAETACKVILGLDPSHPDALHLLGVLAHQGGSDVLASRLIRRAIAHTGIVADYHSNLGIVLKAAGQTDAAVAAYQLAQRLSPSSPEAHSNLGNVRRVQGREDLAITCYRTALVCRPDYPDALVNLAETLLAAGAESAAGTVFRRLLRWCSTDAGVQCGLGVVQARLGLFEAAERQFTIAAILLPGLDVAWSNLGKCLRGWQVMTADAETRRAARYLGRAIAVRPDAAEAHGDLGHCQMALGDLAAARKSHRRAVVSRPELSGGYCNLGLTEKRLGTPAMAMTGYRRALFLDPNHAEASNNLGNILREVGRLEAAESQYRHAIAANALMAEAHNNLGITLQEAARLDAAAKFCRSALVCQPAYAEPMMNLAFNHLYAQAAGLADLSLWARRLGVLQPAQMPPVTVAADSRRRQPRIGLVSADFRRHAVGFLAIPAVEALARAGWDLTCYSNHRHADELTRRFSAAARRWRTIAGMPDRAVADLIRADGIDILIDLSGYSAGNRLSALALKPAALQIASWIGYPATSGVPAMDYYLADRWQIPVGAEGQFSEQVIRLPDSYIAFQPAADAPAISDPPALVNGFITFASFNQIKKITPEIIALWSRILTRMPTARLLMKSVFLDEPQTRQYFIDLFAAQGIAPERLNLIGGTSSAEHMAVMGRADIALDSHPYSGGMTTLEALWMGLPVVCRPGETFASRHSFGYLSTLGMTEFVARDDDGYIETAVRLAQDLGKLSQLRQSMRQRMLDSPLCDVERFGRQLGDALSSIWRRHCDGLPPQGITVPACEARTKLVAKFTQALQLHQAGLSAQAQRLYREILVADPGHADALHLLGLIAHRNGDGERAVSLIERAIRRNSQFAAYHANLGLVELDQGRPDLAGAAFRRALNCRADFAEAHANLGMVLSLGGQAEDAMRSYRRALVCTPDLASALNNLGNILQEQDRLDDAISAYRRALRVTPDHSEGHRNLGTALQKLGMSEGAAAAQRRALACRPAYPSALSCMGGILLDLNRPAQAIPPYRRALTIDPEFAETRSNLALALEQHDQLFEAVASGRLALLCQPGFAQAHNNLGVALRRSGKAVMAEMSLRRALICDSTFAEAHNNLGTALQEQNRLDEAFSCYQSALCFDSDYADAHGNLALLYLLHGRLPEGWREYEWRWRIKHAELPAWTGGKPQWRGEALAGRTIVLHAEQGMGDAIHFCRYAPLVAARGGIVVLQVHRPLVTLLAGLPGVAAVIAKGETLPPFDLHCPLMSLPGVFGTDLSSIPAPIPYLAAEPERVARWRERLPDGFRIGIVWAGSPGYKSDRSRSVPLAQFAPLAGIPGVRLISLQKMHGLDQLDDLPDGMSVATLGEDFDAGEAAFLDSAAVMMSLDLIVTVDSAIGHLAGALGRKVWLILSAVPHWPWLLAREDSPWYPHTRLFRSDDWSVSVQRMAARLTAVLAESP